MDRRDELGPKTRGRAAAAHDHAHEGAVELRRRVIPFHSRRERKTFRTHIAGDADDLSGDRGDASDETATDRVFAREKFFRHRLVDDNDIWRLASVAPGEVAALFVRDAERLKKSG